MEKREQGAGAHPKVPTSDEFTRTLGQVTWLMSMSPAYKKRPIEDLETLVFAPLMFKQVRVYKEGPRPIACVIWAYASDKVKAKAEASDKLGLEDWRSGSEVIVVDCISPFADEDKFKNAFLKEVECAKAASIGGEV